MATYAIIQPEQYGSIETVCGKETDLAVRISVDGVQVWLPKSQIRTISYIQGVALIIPAWLRKNSAVPCKFWMTEDEIQQHLMSGAIEYIPLKVKE